MVTTLAVMAACAAVLSTLAHQVIEITQFGYQEYVSTQEFRYEYAQFRYVYDMIRWTMLTCAQKLTSSQLSLPHGTKQKRIMKKLQKKRE